MKFFSLCYDFPPAQSKPIFSFDASVPVFLSRFFPVHSLPSPPPPCVGYLARWQTVFSQAWRRPLACLERPEELLILHFLLSLLFFC